MDTAKGQVTRGVSARSASNIASQTRDESVVKESSRQPEWESSTAYVSRSETSSANFFSSPEETADQSSDGFDDSDRSPLDHVALPEELESVFNSMTERPAKSSSKPVVRSKEVDDLLD